MKFSVIGGGKWGTALAIAYAHKFDDVNLWMWPGELFKEAPLVEYIQQHSTNPLVFPNIRFPNSLNVSGDLEGVVNGADIVLGVIPSEFIAPYLEQIKLLNFGQYVNCSKGIIDKEPISVHFLKTMPDTPYAALSGPNIAAQLIENFRDGAAIKPSFSTLAIGPGSREDLAEIMDFVPYLWISPSTHVEAVEYCGILKQIYAIGLGICVGLGYSGNTTAGLFQECGAEIKKILEFKGLEPRVYDDTKAGYPDLEVTYKFGRHGRMGNLIAMTGLENAKRELRYEALEGFRVTEAVYRQTRAAGLRLPILHEVNAVIHYNRTPKKAVQNLTRKRLMAIPAPVP